MALTSMTGYGRGESSAHGIKAEVELSSVNRKQFDAKIGMPRTLLALESRVNKLIHKSISRGTVTGSLRVVVSDAATGQCIKVDTRTARRYIHELRRAAAKLGLPDDLTARSLIALPEVVRFENVTEDSRKVWPQVKQAVAAAVAQLVNTRKTEGAALEKDLVRRLNKLRRIFNRIRKLAADMPKKHVKQLRDRLTELRVSLDIDDAQLAREAAILADRSDVSEEIVRLESHMEQVTTVLASTDPAGRALDFLCQEMFREINTIGSKAADAGISRGIIQFKTELESIREQVQNVE